MESNILPQLFPPLALCLIMLGMGMSLVPADFKRVILFPKAMILGTVLTLIVIPALTFAILYLMPMQPELSVSFVLLAACAGGATTNLITNLAKGDVALSITLTAIASVITVFTIPVIVNLGLIEFMGEAREIKLPFFKTIIQILVITVIPVLIGMIRNHKVPSLCRRMAKPVKRMTALFLVLSIVAVHVKERANLGSFFAQAGPLALILNITGMFFGYPITYLFTRNKAQSVTIGTEIGVVNGTLGIAIAAGILYNSVMTIPSAIYSIIMFPTVILMVWIGNQQRKKKIN